MIKVGYKLPSPPNMALEHCHIVILAKLEHQLQSIPSKAALRFETCWNIAFIWNYKGFHRITRTRSAFWSSEEELCLPLAKIKMYLVIDKRFERAAPHPSNSIAS